MNKKNYMTGIRPIRLMGSMYTYTIIEYITENSNYVYIYIYTYTDIMAQIANTSELCGQNESIRNVGFNSKLIPR